MTNKMVPTITDYLVAELEYEALMCDSEDSVSVEPFTLRALLAERAELKRDAERLAAVIKDVHWRVDDTTEQLQATGHDGDRRYGLDEWSGPIKNLKMAIEILAKAMHEQPS